MTSERATTLVAKFIANLLLALFAAGLLALAGGGRVLATAVALVTLNVWMAADYVVKEIRRG